MSLRILVSGSRDWPDSNVIERELSRLAGEATDVTLIHGGCPTGADAMADVYARRLGWTVEVYHAEWKKYGKAAGPLRNERMVKEGHADVAVVFCKDQSRGATGTYRLLRSAGIPTKLIQHR